MAKRKRMRLPNGFGRITEIKGKRLRNPYRAMVTIGKDEFGKPIGKILGYYKTYNEAYAALVEYNKNPYDIDKNITVEELYSIWSEHYFSTLKSDSSNRTITSAWRYCSRVYDMHVNDIRVRHIKGCIDNGYILDKNGKKRLASPGTKSRIKSLWNLMLDYAVEYEICQKNYARDFNLDEKISEEREKNKKDHIPYTDDEMRIMWERKNDKWVSVVIIQCYSGWRPSELLAIKMNDVDLANWTFVGGMKTTAGENRIVPIHTKIRPLVKKLYDESLEYGNETLICNNGVTTYDSYRHKFASVKKRLSLNPKHRPHDGRKQFVTEAKNKGMNDFAIKRIIGHKITDITESVYTVRDIEWLRTEIEKI